jgi:hypothetical protein
MIVDPAAIARLQDDLVGARPISARPCRVPATAPAIGAIFAVGTREVVVVATTSTGDCSGIDNGAQDFDTSASYLRDIAPLIATTSATGGVVVRPGAMPP